MTSKPAQSAIDQALDAPESTDAPARGNVNSLAYQAALLAVGETTSRVELVDEAHTLAEYAMAGVVLRDKLRNGVSSSLRNVSQKHKGRRFEIEIGDMFTTGRRLYLVAIVTRVE